MKVRSGFVVAGRAGVVTPSLLHAPGRVDHRRPCTAVWRSWDLLV